MRCLNQEESRQLDELLMAKTFGFKIEQLMELAGFAVAQAIHDYYPPDRYHQVLVFCGPGNNGGDGLVAARHLKSFGYSPTVVCPVMKPASEGLRAQCRSFGIAVLENTDLMSEFDLIVDAVFGFGFTGQPKSPFKEIIDLMKDSQKPVISVDVPSGWPIEDVPSKDSLKPHMLISLSAPVHTCIKYIWLELFRRRFAPNISMGSTCLEADSFPGTSPRYLLSLILTQYMHSSIYEMFDIEQPSFSASKQYTKLE